MRLLRTSLILLLSLLAAVACNKSANDGLDHSLTEKESQQLLRKLIPYSAKLPEGLHYTTRFDSKLDPFYSKEVTRYKLEYYYLSTTDSFNYFLISRPASSLYEKRVGIAGKFKIDEKGAIINYEESFWTFKMKPGELEKKFSTLFRDYIEGKDLSKYQSQNIKEEWIEFPDQNYFYDRKEQKWKAIGQL